MSWIDCVVDEDYQIYSEYPHQIRRKSNHRIIKESSDKSTGYINCCLNQQKFKKHRIIAQQFIPNSNNLPIVDHINHDKTDNHISNLRWASISDNNKNISSMNGNEFELFDEIPAEPEDIILVNHYGAHQFENLYYANDYFYYDNDVNYRRLHIYELPSGTQFIYMNDTNNRPTKICYPNFKKLYHIT